MTAQPQPGSRATSGRFLGFFDGVVSVFGGLAFIVGRPAMWGWAAVPILVATLLFLGLGTAAVWGGSALAEHLLASPADAARGWTSVGIWALRIVFWLVGVVLAFLLSISLAQPLAGFALDAIARRQERALGGREWPEQPVVASALRSARVTFVALAMSLPILAVLTLITVVVPPASVVTIPLKFVVTGLTVAYDFLDYPLGLRGSGVRARGTFVREHFAAVLGFGLASALLLLIPGVGLLLLPAGVAGATRLVVAGDPPA